MNDNFVHLHVHTEYSLLDGATRIKKLFAKCAKLGMPAVAITDHGNMFGAIDFFKKAVSLTDPDSDPYRFVQAGREFKVKPIFGCEFYMTDDMDVKQSVGGKMPKFNHLVLLVKNKVGYHNMLKLTSESFTRGLYYKPRIDMKLLAKHCEGLICLSACLAGAIPQAILRGEVERAEEIAEEFVGLFGDDFYIEVQDHNLREQKMSNPILIDIARKHKIKIVATNDVHYIDEDDNQMQKVLQCISFRRTFDESGSGSEDYFPTHEFYLKSGAQMRSLFPNCPDAITNTLEIASKCDYNFFEKKPLLPSFVPSNGMEPYEFLRDITYKGLEYKYKTITDVIRERAEYELSTIHKLGFVDYFLIVYDFIHYSESHDIPVGPGRGSGVGSIVAYAVGITKVDPLRYDLIFERFLNSERVSNPDFDIDFCVDKREDVIQYVVEKYGKDKVSQIITFGTLAAKAAIKDVGRVFNVPYAEVEKITKTMPVMLKGSIEQMIGLAPPKKADENPVISDLKDMYNGDENAKRILDMSIKIESMPRQTGMHAAGVVICRDRISDHVPLQMSSDGIVTTQFNMIEVEELGLLKMDFLGLRTLTDIKKAIDYVKVTKGINIDFYNMEYNDAGVFKLIGEGDTHAVFQLESEGMKKFMRDLKPTTLEDIIAGVSLYRPGPMDSIPQYVRNKRNPSGIKYAHPILEPILNVTYGVIVYQEQVMRIVREMGGYSFGRADIVRRLMSKKKAEAMAKEKKIFISGTVDNGTVISGALAKGVPQDVADKVFEEMSSFARYAFNKSHAAAYAYLTYQTAYLKCYHTVEFITAVLNNRITSIDEIRNYLGYLKERGIGVLPPSINKSNVEFAVEDGKVRIGMSAIKNVGAAVITEIVKEREENGEFLDFRQFVKRMDKVTLNKKLLESLIFSGTFDCFNLSRSSLIACYEQVLDMTTKERNARTRGQFSLFDSMDGGVIDDFKYPNLREFSLFEKLKREKEVAGVYLTGHPLEEHTNFLKQFSVNAGMFKPTAKSENEGEEGDELEEVTGGITDDMTVRLGGVIVEATKRITKNNKELGIGKLEDLYGTVDLMVSGFRLASLKEVFVPDTLVTITGKVKIRDEGYSIWVDKIEPWTGKSTINKVAKKICFYMSFTEVDESIMDKLQDLLLMYPGEDETFVKDTDKNELHLLGIKTELTDALVAELNGLVGASNIKII